MKPLLPVMEARARILRGARPIAEVEHVPLAEAAGRHLAADLKATRAQPPFSASAMDGYAVRAADSATAPRTLTVIGEAPAGRSFRGTVGAGQAVRIFTGAPVPDGADTVIAQEDAEPLAGNRVRIDAGVTGGSFVRPAGLDFAQGDLVLKAGQRLDAGRLTLAASMNMADLPVVRRPHVAILATGDELVPPGGNPGPDQIVASTSFGVAAIAREDGATVTGLGIAADRQEDIEAAAARAAAVRADVLVTLGGASVGDHDLVRDALAARGMTLDFWRVAMRPGKPLVHGRMEGMQVLGLPGNPASSLVCAHLFLRPLIARLKGEPALESRHAAVLGRAVEANDRREGYLRAALTVADGGTLVATPFEHQDSSMARLFAEADCLVIRPPHASAAAGGTPCQIVLLRQPDR